MFSCLNQVSWFKLFESNTSFRIGGAATGDIISSSDGATYHLKYV